MIQITPKQLKALDYLTDNTTIFVGYGGGAGGGKTFLGCVWLMQMAYFAPFTNYFIGRDRLKDTRESVLMTWRKVADYYNFHEWSYRDNQITFKNKSVINFLDLSFNPQADPDYERLGSKEYTAGWIEEAGSVHKRAFEVLKARIGRWKNLDYNIKKKMLCTFNPKKNWVYDFFYKPFSKQQESEDVKFVPALAIDNPYLPQDYIKTLESINDNTLKQRLLYGNFEYEDSDNCLTTRDKILDLFSNTFITEGKQRYITADIALQGADKFVIVVWYGLVAKEIFTMPKSDGKDVLQQIKRLAVLHHVPTSNICYDADGVGGYLSGFLENAKPFHNNGSPIKVTGDREDYQNLKTQCYYKLADYINEAKIYISAEMAEIDKEHLIGELEQIKRPKNMSDLKLQIIHKNDVKNNIGRSPDFSDAVMLRMYFELVPTNLWTP